MTRQPVVPVFPSPSFNHRQSLTRRFATAVLIYLSLVLLLLYPELVAAETTAAGPVVAAVAWVKETFLNTLVVTTVSVIAISVIGIAMLAGRIQFSMAITIMAGIGLVLAASWIARTLTTAVTKAATPT